jgi:two-component system cell cycle response regulator
VALPGLLARAQARGRQGEPTLVTSSSAWLASSLRDARILIVDDEKLQRGHLAQIVQSWGAIPLVAQTTSESLQLYRDAAPDLVLLDVLMPQIDGYKLAKIFKSDGKYVPIILLTALADLDSKRRGLAAGGDEFLSKPVDALELQMRVSSMLRIRRLTTELEEANRKLQTFATIDPLTQLMNRRVVDERLEHEFARATRHRRPLACLMCDVDHFKKVNDTHGHGVGDVVLTKVGAAIAATIRKTDLAGRYGGEEFLVLVPETTGAGARILGERLRHAVASADRDGSSPAVTVSIGIGTTELGVPSAKDLLRRADEALYEAKAAGRNRVVVAR